MRMSRRVVHSLPDTPFLQMKRALILRASVVAVVLSAVFLVPAQFTLAAPGTPAMHENPAISYSCLSPHCYGNAYWNGSISGVSTWFTVENLSQPSGDGSCSFVDEEE